MQLHTILSVHPHLFSLHPVPVEGGLCNTGRHSPKTVPYDAVEPHPLGSIASTVRLYRIVASISASFVTWWMYSMS